MKLDKNLVSVHAYLCADGYVIKNPETQKHKYFCIGLRNTNLALLKDFQEKFEKRFNVKPHLIKGERCRIGSKKIYEILTKKFGSFYSWEWKMPKLNKNLSKVWLRTYFDCEGWVFCKTHQNRHIGIDCVNERGINQIISALDNLNIKTIKKYIKKRNIYRVLIYGKDNLNNFCEKIGFLHPDKSKRLKEVIDDFVIYKWNFPKEERECKKFVFNILKDKLKIKKPYYVRIISKEETNLNNLIYYLNKFYNVEGKMYKRVNGRGTIYYEININKKKEIEKLINHEIIKDIFVKN
jgi:hypothetical protein